MLAFESTVKASLRLDHCKVLVSRIIREQWKCNVWMFLRALFVWCNDVSISPLGDYQLLVCNSWMLMIWQPPESLLRAITRPHTEESWSHINRILHKKVLGLKLYFIGIFSSLELLSNYCNWQWEYFRSELCEQPLRGEIWFLMNERKWWICV